MKSKAYIITFILLWIYSCDNSSIHDSNTKSINGTEIDTTIWYAESLIVNSDSLSLLEDLYIYRILDTCVASWTLNHDSLKQKYDCSSCKIWQLTHDTIVLGINSLNCPFYPMAPYTIIDSSSAYYQDVRMFKSEDEYYHIDNGKVIMKRIPISKKMSKDIITAFTDNPDTTIIQKGKRLLTY